MRDIRFRGRRLDNGDWTYGDLCHGEGKSYIAYDNDFVPTCRCGICDLISDRFFEVDPATVGQYTGLKDKNGVDVYEGDIVTANWYDYEEPNNTQTGVVEFSVGWMAYWIANYGDKTFSEINGHGCYSWDIEVISNIHESEG